MTSRLVAVNKLRPRIISQGVVDLEGMARRVSKNTTYNPEEIFSILRLNVREAIAALQAGETVKIDRLLNLAPNLKVGGGATVGVRPDRGMLADLDNPRLWTAAKVANHENLTKSADELVAQWNEAHPGEPVED